jgi:hypothetical protein
MGNDINRATALNDTITLSSATQDTITLSSVSAPVYQTDTIDLSMLGAVGSGNLTSPYTVTSSINPYPYPNAAVGGGFTAGMGWTNTTSNTPWLSQSNTAPKINLDGEGADIVVNGHSLVDAINSIRDRLNCLQINPALEAEWEELRALGDQYRELEQQILEKQATWDRLRAMPPPEID